MSLPTFFLGQPSILRLQKVLQLFGKIRRCRDGISGHFYHYTLNEMSKMNTHLMDDQRFALSIIMLDCALILRAVVQKIGLTNGIQKSKMQTSVFLRFSSPKRLWVGFTMITIVAKLVTHKLSYALQLLPLLLLLHMMSLLCSSHCANRLSIR